ncbi:MAG: 50S ribosomal protein L9 [Candidatus Cloacimonetes bacterium 4572_55]|nr:MAG: 50S ribosomal protein L9 [Candidatus Cloacimonetes bacterium 4572_55]
MEVILLENVAQLGASGEKVKVANGYGRNYLLPQKKALLATKSATRVYEHHQKMKLIRENKSLRQARQLTEEIEKTSITATVQVGEDNKMFGSVTSIDIHRLLTDQGVDVDRRKISLPDPLKELGVFTVPIKLHPDVEAKLKVWVVKT